MQIFLSVTAFLKFIRLCEEAEMNQRKIDKMIPIALSLLSQMEVDKNSMKTGDYEIGKAYFGYMASFGPSVVQSGIAKTLAFYYKAKGESEGKRSLVTDFIMSVFLETYPDYKKNNAGNLLILYDKVTTEKNTLQRLALADKILEAAIACKLAMETYHAEEKENKNGGTPDGDE